MYITTQTVLPVNIIFGAGFVQEHHADEEQPSLLAPERREPHFAAVLESLRSALGIRR